MKRQCCGEMSLSPFRNLRTRHSRRSSNVSAWNQGRIAKQFISYMGAWSRTPAVSKNSLRPALKEIWRFMKMKETNHDRRVMPANPSQSPGRLDHARAYAIKKGWTVADEHIYEEERYSSRR